jgi:hypothetical protein
MPARTVLVEYITRVREDASDSERDRVRNLKRPIPPYDFSKKHHVFPHADGCTGTRAVGDGAYVKYDVCVENL